MNPGQAGVLEYVVTAGRVKTPRETLMNSRPKTKQMLQIACQAARKFGRQ